MRTERREAKRKLYLSVFNGFIVSLQSALKTRYASLTNKSRGVSLCISCGVSIGLSILLFIAGSFLRINNMQSGSRTQLTHDTYFSGSTASGNLTPCILSLSIVSTEGGREEADDPLDLFGSSLERFEVMNPFDGLSTSSCDTALREVWLEAASVWES
jgi:formate/nitrite transporter FocA (FNT family)